jgi:hypothetical protein
MRIPSPPQNKHDLHVESLALQVAKTVTEAVPRPSMPRHADRRERAPEFAGS